jgi:hypothetical protein
MKDCPVRTTVAIDDELYEFAIPVADLAMDKGYPFREALKIFVSVQAARPLAALGAMKLDSPDVPRRGVTGFSSTPQCGSITCATTTMR